MSAIFAWLRPARIELFHRLFPGMALRRASRRTKENEIEIRLLPVLADPDRVSIDVGANIGKYTAALIPVSRRVIAVEPHPRLAHVLGSFPRNKVSVVRGIASRTAGETLQLEVERTSRGEADALGHVATGSARATTATRYPVETITLDGCSDDAVGFVKIDVEGHELDVLASAEQLIERDHPVFLVEAESRHRADAPADVFAFFAARNYHGVFIRDRQPHPVDRFSLDMQNEDDLIGYESRESSRYVNNFIFLPPGRDVEQAMSDFAGLLATGR